MLGQSIRLIFAACEVSKEMLRVGKLELPRLSDWSADGLTAMPEVGMLED